MRDFPAAWSVLAVTSSLRDVLWREYINKESANLKTNLRADESVIDQPGGNLLQLQRNRDMGGGGGGERERDFVVTV